jgi:serine/threonine protein kinase
MTTTNRQQFLQSVAKSNIVTKQRLGSWLKTADKAAGPNDLARDLIQQKLLTVWQAKMLLKGTVNLRIGNYLLTDRIDHTAMGDRFEAVHEQLSRPVTIQYLPAQLCAGPKSRKAIFEYGSKLASLDHPNLVHVFDIDLENERVFLVSEATDGKTLTEACHEMKLKAPLFSALEFANIVSGCLDGLLYAHENSVVHSAVGPDTIFVSESGQAKLRGLTRFSIQNSIIENSGGSAKPQTAADDLQAMASVCDQLLKFVSYAPEEFASLPSQIRRDSPAALQTIKEWQKQTQPAKPPVVIKPEPSLPPSAAEPNQSVSDKISDTLGTRTGTKTVEPNASSAAAASYSKNEDDNFLTKMARRNPVAMLVSMAALCLILIGSTVLAANHLKQPKQPPQLRDKDIATRQTPEPASRTNNPKESALASSGSGRADAVRAKRSASNKSDRERPSNSEQDEILAKAKDPETNRAAIAALFSKPKSASTKNETASTPDHTDAETKLAAESFAAESPSTELPSGTTMGSETKTSTASPMASSATTELAETVKTNPEKAEPEFLTPGLNPFAKFPDTVDLPSVDDLEEVSLGKLILERNHLLGAELLCSDAIHRSRPVFSLSRQDDDKQTWDVQFQRNKRANPVTFAVLKKTPSELTFQWLTEAADVKLANYLRNCRIKLATPDSQKWVTLRKPIRIEGFQLTDKTGVASVEVKIPWLPQPESINASAAPIRIKSENRPNDRSLMAPADMTRDYPARMFFHDLKSRFYSLDIAADLRKSLRLEAALMVQPLPDSPAFALKDPATIATAAAQLKQLAMQANQTSDQAQRSDITKTKKDEYRRAAKKILDRATLMEFYVEITPQLLNKPIPVTITYDLNDQHRIILAYTAESDETK